MPSNIVIRNLTPETRLGNESPVIATREDLRSGARGDSGTLPPSEPGSPPVITSVVDNGDGTLTIQGSNFGSKAQAAPIIWDMGDDVRLDGIEDSNRVTTDGFSVNGETLITRSRTHRHPGVSAHYESANKDLNASVSYPYLASVTRGQKLYSSFYLKLPCDPRFVDAAPYSGLSGTFITGEPGRLGEEITITVGGGDYQAFVLDVDSSAYASSFFALYSPNKALSSLDGTVSVVGNISGASCTLDFSSGYAASPPAKLWRINQSGSGEGVLGIVQLGVEQFFLKSQDSSLVDSIYMDRNMFAPDYNNFAVDGEWFLAELYVDWTIPSNLKAELTLTGGNGQELKVIDNVDGTSNYLDTNQIIIQVGVDSQPQAVDVEFGEVYVDSSPARVLLGDGGSYANSTIIERQFILSWSDTQIIVEKYEGALTGSMGCFVVNADNKIASGGPV